MRLSIAIPVYNFAEFLPATLRSILDQPHGHEIEVVVTDGASTDETPTIMQEMCARHPNLAYNRLARKGGIDRDMALAVEATRGEYVWIFSGDDIMHDGALAVVLQKLLSGDDVYLCRHTECTSWMERLFDYPILEPDVPEVFELSDPLQRKAYFSRTQNSEAFFSFCGGLVIRRATWDRVPFDPAWAGTCWAHSARLFSVLDGGLRVNYLGRALLDRRADNDSFSRNGHVERARIQVEGFHDIVDNRFGSRSHEAREMRRAIRNEFGPTRVLTLRLLCFERPAKESKRTLDRIVARAYCDWSYACLRTRLVYKLMPLWMVRRKFGDLHQCFLDPDGHREEQKRLRAVHLAQPPA